MKTPLGTLRATTVTLQKTIVASLKPRLVSVRFSKTKSPAYINDGDGWPQGDAVHLLDNLDLKFSLSQEDPKDIKFTQLDRPQRLGELTFEPSGFVGVELVLRAAA